MRAISGSASAGDNRQMANRKSKFENRCSPARENILAKPDSVRAESRSFRCNHLPARATGTEKRHRSMFCSLVSLALQVSLLPGMLWLTSS